MLDSISHRGPDDCGTFHDDFVSLGHRRLSIIDTSPLGHQPMFNEDYSIVITFNGEIYNFQKLKTELIDNGHRFRSKTDTEVLLHGYEQWGMASLLYKLEGMFAFTLWDSNLKKLYLARDCFGIKPLYYKYGTNKLVFASEVKALLAYDKPKIKEINPKGIIASLQHIGTPFELTVYKEYKQLEPGQFICWDINREQFNIETFWQWRLAPDIYDMETAKKLFWESICKSVEKHLVSDVPVGLFLSGGIDSSLIAVACAELGRDITCLTIAMNSSNPDHDESQYASSLCRHLGLTHKIHNMDVNAGKMYDTLLHKIYDEPFASSAALSSAYISEVARKDFKVMLAGDGGDELFGGYNWYLKWIELYGQAGVNLRGFDYIKSKIKSMTNFNNAIPVKAINGYAKLMGSFSPCLIKKIFTKDFLEEANGYIDPADVYLRADNNSLEGIERLQNLDMKIFLPSVCLTKVDRASMYYGLEVRLPILDKTIAEFSARLAPEIRNPHNKLKGLMKIMLKDKMPEYVLNKPKRGFSTPISHWFPDAELRKNIKSDMQGLNFWKPIFCETLPQTLNHLKGRSLWRLVHTWNWLKENSVD